MNKFVFSILGSLFFVSCSISPSNNFRGEYFDTSNIKIFNSSSKQIIYFSNEGNKVTTFNSSHSIENEGTWKMDDSNPRRIYLSFSSGRYSERSGYYEFSKDYRILTSPKGYSYFLRR